MVIKMSPISKTYKSYTGPDFFFQVLFFFSSKPRNINLHLKKQK